MNTCVQLFNQMQLTEEAMEQVRGRDGGRLYGDMMRERDGRVSTATRDDMKRRGHLHGVRAREEDRQDGV